MDFGAIALACRRADAAYQTTFDTSKSAFTALGDSWVSLYTTDSMQAALSVDPVGATWLSISGTRASDGYLADVFRDVSLEPKAVNGGTVTAGVWANLETVWDWARDTAPAGTVFNVTGHSLGAARCQASVAIVDPKRLGALYAFASPKFIGADLFKSHAAVFQRLIPVVNGNDGWASWPWLDLRWRSRAPVQTVWLKDDRGTFTVLPDGNQWKGGWAFEDHDIGSYQKRLDVIAAASDIKPAA